MPFSVRHVLRQIPKDSLEAYFGLRGVPIDPAWWKRPEPKLATTLADHILSKRTDATDLIVAEVVKIDPLSNELGRTAFINAASHERAMMESLGRLANDYDRSLWMLINHPQIFREAEELLYFDQRSRGARSRHYLTTPNLPVSREAADVTAFQSAVCAFYRRHEGSGASCHVEFADRHTDNSIQATLYVEGLPDHVVEFVERGFRRRVSYPAQEAAIVYDPASGTVSTVLSGGKDAHEALREAFARSLLKIDPKFDAVIPRPFTLDSLTTPTDLSADPSLGAEAVRVRRLKLSPRRYDAGLLTIEAPADAPEVSVYDLADRWLAGKAGGCRKFSVIHATIAIHLKPLPDRKRGRTISIELTKPNTSNLKDMTEADRAVAEAHIEKWQLRAPAA